MTEIKDKKFEIPEAIPVIESETEAALAEEKHEIAAEEVVVDEVAATESPKKKRSKKEKDKVEEALNAVEEESTESSPATKAKKSTQKKKPLQENGITIELIDEDSSNLPNYRIRAKRFSRRERKQLVTISAEDKYKKQFSDISKATAELFQSHRTGTIITSTITGIEQAKNPNTGEQVLLLICKHGPYKVVIPAKDFLELDIKKEDGTKDFRQEKLILSRRIGSEIDFICKYIDKENLKAIGDRLSAMQVQRKRFWFATNEGSGKGRELHFVEGMIMQARVVATGRTSIHVETLGVECAIPLSDLSYTIISDAQDYFATGDKVNIRLLAVKRDSKTNDVKIKASVKAAQEDPRYKLFDLFDEGGWYDGKVTMLDTTKGSGVYVDLDGITVLCWWPKDTTVHIGDTVRVQINIKEEESLRLFGQIIHVTRRGSSYR